MSNDSTRAARGTPDAGLRDFDATAPLGPAHRCASQNL